MTKEERIREIIKLNNENTKLKDFFELRELRNRRSNFFAWKNVNITYKFKKEYESSSEAIYIKGDLKEKILNLFEQEIEKNNKRIDELLGVEDD